MVLTTLFTFLLGILGNAKAEEMKVDIVSVEVPSHFMGKSFTDKPTSSLHLIVKDKNGGRIYLPAGLTKLRTLLLNASLHFEGDRSLWQRLVGAQHPFHSYKLHYILHYLLPDALIPDELRDFGIVMEHLTDPSGLTSPAILARLYTEGCTMADSAVHAHPFLCSLTPPTFQKLKGMYQELYSLPLLRTARNILKSERLELEARGHLHESVRSFSIEVAAFLPFVALRRLSLVSKSVSNAIGRIKYLTKNAQLRKPLEDSISKWLIPGSAGVLGLAGLGNGYYWLSTSPSSEYTAKNTDSIWVDFASKNSTAKKQAQMEGILEEAELIEFYGAKDFFSSPSVKPYLTEPLAQYDLSTLSYLFLAADLEIALSEDKEDFIGSSLFWATSSPLNYEQVMALIVESQTAKELLALAAGAGIHTVEFVRYYSMPLREETPQGVLRLPYFESELNYLAMALGIAGGLWQSLGLKGPSNPLMYPNEDAFLAASASEDTIIAALALQILSEWPATASQVEGRLSPAKASEYIRKEEYNTIMDKAFNFLSASFHKLFVIPAMDRMLPEAPNLYTMGPALLETKRRRKGQYKKLFEMENSPFRNLKENKK